MTFICGGMIDFVADHLAILFNHQFYLPAASLGSFALYYFLTRLQCLVFLVMRLRKIKGLCLGSFQRIGHAILQNRNSVNGYGNCLIGIACLDADSGTGGIDKPEIRSAPADGRIHTRSHIRRLKGMGTAHGNLHTGF